jgi:peptidoglycan/xylan/chitin deacetylase (PgdA/CDA1 family)
MGTVVISADAELGWGFHDLKDPPTDRLANARYGWQTLLDFCDEYEVPATWAVVGHLLLDDCDGEHADHPTPAGWFDHERGDDAMPRSLRFGDGLVDDLLNAEVDHDVGLHTFSHVEFGDPDTTRQLARAEVATSLEIARERGLELRSFVFPRNNVAHLDALAAYGIECYRGVNPRTHQDDAWDGAVGKIARATLVRRPPPLVEPAVDSYGLVNVPASLHLFSFEGTPRSLVEPVIGDPVVRQAKLGIDAAAEEDGVFHMWLHPNSITESRDERRLRAIFEYLDRQRAETSLSVQTMVDVAKDARAQATDSKTSPVEGA